MDNTKTEKSGIRPGVILAVLCVVAVVAALVGGKMLGWFGGGKPIAENTADLPPVSTEPASPQAAPRTPGSPRNPATAPLRPRDPRSFSGNTAATAPGTPAPGTTTIPGDPTAPGEAEMNADWSVKLDDILGADTDEAKKADLLLAMWKTLPEEGQVETMQHISNLLEDERFPLLVQTFTNVTTPEAVLDIIMSDALNRPNSMKLPALLDVAKTPNHPKAEEAREILEVFVDENHGDDWAKWDSAVKKWLKENPDEAEVE